MKTTLEMFKEIEDLEVAPDNDGEPLKSVKDIAPNWCNKIEQALQHLEAIDNANPSEALKELNYIGETCYVEAGNAEEKCLLYAKDYIGYTTIKQALLKTQEPKQYLKWEDLEFTKDFKCQKVKMNDNDYRIRYTLDDFGGKCCFLYDSARNHYIVLNKQFFNDLHLERVEE